MSDGSDGWKTVQVSPLVPEVARGLSEMDAKTRTQWYWLNDAMAASPRADGSGDRVEFAPVALLRQVRADDGGDQTRVVPGKLTLLGTVIPVSEQEPTRRRSEDENRWTTTAVAHLPAAIRMLTTTNDPGGALWCFLLQENQASGESRVKLGSYFVDEMVPVTDYTNGFDLGPWKLA